MAGTINVGALISGGGSNLQAIIDACKAGSIDARILFTGSDTPGVKGLERAQKEGIDTFVVNYSQIIRSCKKGISQSDFPPDFDMDDILKKQQLINSPSTDLQSANKESSGNDAVKDRPYFFYNPGPLLKKNSWITSWPMIWTFWSWQGSCGC